ncbi:DGQHR domain-containing protein (plasmid) [Lactiplantibacillus plantarum]|uniref:DGQHR domain-containing protein n=1 Tax=Lactiplantibacillus plantarum TaxID=1590 RepID=UPI00338F9EAE
MDNIKLAFKYKQSNETFYSTILTFSDIYNNFKASVYGPENPLGYQRAISESHLKTIVASLQRGDENISPNSVILGIDEPYLNKLIVSDKNTPQEMVKIDFSKINSDNSKAFRIIDGQHRIAAISKFTKENQNKYDVNSMKFNVIIYSVPENNLVKEVDLFTDINSKSKRLRTDLAIMAKYNIELKNHSTDINYMQHIIITTILKINTTIESPMFNSIKIDPNNQSNLGSVSIKAFIEAIYNIVKYAVKHDNNISQKYNDLVTIDSSSENQITAIDDIADCLAANLFIPMWNIIFKKWPNTKHNHRQFPADSDTDSDDSYFYDKDYYIQQTIGIKSLSYLMSNVVKDKNFDIKGMLEKFKQVISKSSFTDDDWKKKIKSNTANSLEPKFVPGRLNGMSSEAGFKKTMDMIVKGL